VNKVTIEWKDDGTIKVDWGKGDAAILGLTPGKITKGFKVAEKSYRVAVGQYRQRSHAKAFEEAAKAAKAKEAATEEAPAEIEKVKPAATAAK
jgi:hypothetical protein